MGKTQRRQGLLGGGKSGGRMTSGDAARVQSAAARNPDSRSAQSGFASRAQSAAAKHDSGQRDQ